MDNPTISVVCSVYNGEQTIEATITSILEQHFEDFEFIIVDDGSVDSTPRILKEMDDGDSRIRNIYKPNQGLTKSLIEACHACNGEFIARIDCGDLSRPNRLGTQIKHFQNDPDLVLCGAQATYIDRRGRLIGHNRCYTSRPKTALMTRNPFVHSSVMFRTDSYHAVGGYRSEIPYAQDYDLWSRLANQGRIYIIKEQLIDELLDTASLSFANVDQQLHYGANIAHKYSQTLMGKILPYEFFQQHLSLVLTPTKPPPLSRADSMRLVLREFGLLRLLFSMSFGHKIGWFSFFLLGAYLYRTLFGSYHTFKFRIR